ncbi:hypothetical protein HDU97_004252 [Phlyctochytrium planicorne]|nr:hypothetical protein HDU97_004252 [Phlyctochytrium planicorne]
MQVKSILSTLLVLLFAILAVAKNSQVPDDDVFRRYIVVFKDNAAKSSVDDILDKLKKVGGKIVHKYDLINGIAIESPISFSKTIGALPSVDYVEEDGKVETLGKPEAL